MASNDIADWYRRIPPMTKYWFTGSVVMPLLGRFGLLPAHAMYLSYTLLVHKFQIWRPITAVFYFPLTPQTGFQYLMNLYFLYNYSTRLESGHFDGRPADYLFLLIFNWICLVIIGLLVNLPWLMSPMILSVLYVWCQFNKDQIVQFWFGTQFKAVYLPWVLLIFNMIVGGGGLYELIGILVGHAYFFVMIKYPQDFGGRQLFSTPSILYRYFPNRHGGMGGFGVPPTSTRQAQDQNQGGHRWGRGHQLGGN